MKTIAWNENKLFNKELISPYSAYFNSGVIQNVLDFHKSFPHYNETPLICLAELANYLGVKRISVKDESQRFHLNAFKALGGLYAIGNYIGERLGIPNEQLTYEKLKSAKVKEQLGTITFTTATDGNHGRGVAWAAKELGHEAIVFMPKGSSAHRLQHIKDTGAQGYVTEMNYDETVRYVAEMAQKEGWVVVQDTAWEGYEEIPMWIMQGYAAMGAEIIAELQDDIPTHLFLQAGVGSFAAAIIAYFKLLYRDQAPVTVIVEPNKADCFYQSFRQGEGKAVNVDGDLHSIMAGLACGVPSTIAWEIIKNDASYAFSCPDEVAATGMRVLGSPLKGDQRIISGESGAATMGLLYHLLSDCSLGDIKEKLKLDKNAHILLINTEGDTDPKSYREIVWEGSYSNK